MNNEQFDKLYRFRFLPLILMVLFLIVVLVLEHVYKYEVQKWFNVSTFFIVLSAFYIGALNQRKLERSKEEEEQLLNPPPTTIEEKIETYYDEVCNGIKQQTSNIIFRSLYLVFGIILFMLSISIFFFHKSYIFGGVLFVISLLATIYSGFVLRKWIAILKYLKEEKRKIEHSRDS